MYKITILIPSRNRPIALTRCIRSLMLQKKFNLFLEHKVNDYNKVIEVDPDKSISIRSFLIGAISENNSNVKNVLESHDVLSAINCLKKLGVKIKRLKAKNYLIKGKGITGYLKI